MIHVRFNFHQIGTLLLSFYLLACQSKPEQQETTKPKPITEVIGVARLEPEQGIIALYAGGTGRVMSMSVAENDSLAKGQEMLSIDQAVEHAQLVLARSKIGTQRAAIDAQKEAVVALQLSAGKAQADFDLNKKLLAAKGITQQSLDESAAQAAQARQDYLKGLADLEQARSKLRELNADVDVQAAQLREKKLNAPYSGQLLEWTVKVGDYVKGDTQVGQMAPEGALIARTEVDELFAERVKAGQKADIRSQATGKIIGSGTVYFTGAFLKRKSLFEDETAQEDRRVREVRIRLAPGAGLLMNARVDCIIHLN